MFILQFCWKYRHMFQVADSGIIYTDHKPLTWLLTSNGQEGMYAR